MITAKAGQTLDTANFVHGCFMVKVGTDFGTYQQILKYAEQGEYTDGSGKLVSSTPTLEGNAAKVLDGISTSPQDQSAYLPTYFSRRKCRDSSLGGNDAINPLPQFGVDDDIGHPAFHANYGGTVDVNGWSTMMGQVYSENYDDTQQILYLSFGIPLFNNLGTFWGTAVDTDMASYLNKGTGITANKIGYLIGTAPIRLISVATIPFKFVAQLLNNLEKVPITKYYAFRSNMPMYFRLVNTILVHLATNMNIMGSSYDYNGTGSNTSDTTPIQLENQGTKQTQDLSGITTVFQNYGLDMAQIQTKRFFYENGKLGSVTDRYTDQALFDTAGADDQTQADPNQSTNANANASNSQGNQSSDGSTPAGTVNWKLGWFDAFASAYKNTIYDGHLYIGFRIDKGMGASESFSNSTGESKIAQAANAKFQEGQDAGFATAHGDIGSGAIASLLGDTISGLKGVIEGVASSFNLDPLAQIATGAAKVNIPDVWTSSSYSRSASFTITCLSPYGDMESIFQSEYVPLACMLAGALPRAAGLSSHAAPMICQAYCRGIFSSPLCMIESLEVTRGADQYGFTANRLPLKLTMSVTLKDLTPVMNLNMGGDKGLAAQLMGAEDNFNEYMLTLSGMGLRDRLSPFIAMKRKATILLNTLYRNKLSPFMLGMEGGSQITASRMISAFLSGGRGLPGR